MFCEQCGKDIPKDSKFCPDCGTKVVVAEVAEVAETVAPIVEPVAPKKVEQAPPPPKPQPVPVATQNVQYNNRNNLVKPLSIGAYIGIFILMAIPIVNLILLLVWSFGDSVNLNKKHFAIASLILLLVTIIILVVIIIMAVRLGYGVFDWYYNF